MPRRIMEGVVVSAKSAKTVVVRVDRTYLHPLLKKAVRRSSKYHVHDETGTIEEGQTVRICECPPRSRLKRWEVVEAKDAKS